MKLIKDVEYSLMEESEELTIKILNLWLEDWLFKKEDCPNCSKRKFNEND